MATRKLKLIYVAHGLVLLDSGALEQSLKLVFSLALGFIGESLNVERLET